MILGGVYAGTGHPDVFLAGLLIHIAGQPGRLGLNRIAGAIADAI
jgi:hypothetical protein